MHIPKTAYLICYTARVHTGSLPLFWYRLMTFVQRVNIMPLLLAGDPNMFARGTVLTHVCQKDLSTIAEWLKANNFSLNEKKTKTLHDVVKIYFLCVITAKIWKSHIDYIFYKVARAIWLIHKNEEIVKSRMFAHSVLSAYLPIHHLLQTCVGKHL